MHRSPMIVAALVAATLGLAACGTGSPAASTASTDTSTTTATVGATGASVDPNAVEVNPPGDIPDNQVFVAYDTGVFSVTVPEGWARSNTGDVVTFTDKLNAVSLTSMPTATTPTVASARAQEVPSIKSNGPRVTIGKVTSVDRAGTTAVRITFTRDGAPDPVTGKTVREAVERYEYFKNGTEAIVTVSGPDGADNVDPWRIISDSFKWTGA